MPAALKKKSERNVNDYYPTPESAIEPLLEVIGYKDIVRDWRFAEPCRGEAKAIYKYLPFGSEYCELSEGKDYLLSQWNERPDCIITNPPFSIAMEFLEKSIGEADVCIYLLRLGFLESVRRKEFHQKYPVDHLIVLSKRPSFSGDGKTDGTAYAWFVYDPKKRLGLEKSIYVV